MIAKNQSWMFWNQISKWSHIDGQVTDGPLADVNTER